MIRIYDLWEDDFDSRLPDFDYEDVLVEDGCVESSATEDRVVTTLNFGVPQSSKMRELGSTQS